jgi:hypothetical protein
MSLYRVYHLPVLFLGLSGFMGGVIGPEQSARCGPDVAGQQIVAELEGGRITLAELDAAAGPALARLQEQIYAIRRTALDNLLNEAVISAEVKRRKMTDGTRKKQQGCPPKELASHGAVRPDDPEEQPRGKQIWSVTVRLRIAQRTDRAR